MGEDDDWERDLMNRMPNYIYKGKYFKNNIEPEKSWRIKGLSRQAPEEPVPPVAEEKSVIPKTRAEILAPLREVFLEDKLMDTVVTRTAVPELLEGTEPGYGGVILFGPPGTGKTVLMDALGEVYTRAGAYSEAVSLAQINSSYVGEFARSLETVIKRATEKAKLRGKPSLVCIDEGSVLVTKAEDGARTVSKHYQEAIDVLKRYVGNERGIVLVIATNELPDSFEEALTREGRLTSCFVGYPEREERRKMWQHFASKYKLLELGEEQAYQLADATQTEQGAFIEEFCRTYDTTRRSALLKEKGYTNLVDALEHGENITGRTVAETYTFEQFYADASKYLEDKKARLGEGNGKTKKQPVGFGR
ncbi:AAA family ATPase [Candidatus Woesearchaeota archaeon]|nr:AAA family ATPase [Candidatus Woesearchaeota archaeon]